MDGWMDGWTDGWMDGWMNRWMDGWIDGWPGVKLAAGRMSAFPSGLNISGVM